MTILMYWMLELRRTRFHQHRNCIGMTLTRQVTKWLLKSKFKVYILCKSSAWSNLWIDEQSLWWSNWSCGDLTVGEHVKKRVLPRLRRCDHQAVLATLVDNHQASSTPTSPVQQPHGWFDDHRAGLTSTRPVWSPRRFCVAHMAGAKPTEPVWGPHCQFDAHKASMAPARPV